MTATDNETLALDRNGLEVLGMDDCLALVGSVPIARVAANGPASPVVLPVTHVVLGTSIAFRTASGSKLDDAIMNRPVAIEADDWDLATRKGWSVLIRGTAALLEDEALLDQLKTVVDEPWVKSGRDMSWVLVRPNEISGRRIPDSMV